MITKYNLYLEEDKTFPYKYQLGSPSIVSNAVRSIFKLNKIPQEMFVVLGVDTKGIITSAFEANRGDINTSIVDLKSVFARLILSNAAGFFIAHNHPSGNPQPSKADHEVTEEFKKAAKIFNIQMHDHIIVGEENDYSFQAKRLIENF